MQPSATARLHSHTEQAVIRLYLTIGLAFGILIYLRVPVLQAYARCQELRIVIGYLPTALMLLAWSLAIKQGYLGFRSLHLRLTVALLADILVTGSFTAVGERYAPFSLPVFVAIIIGYGWRFGLSYGVAASILGLLVFSAARFVNPIFQPGSPATIGYYLSFLAIPLYMFQARRPPGDPPRACPALPAPGSQRRILLVNGNRTVLRVAQRALQVAGHHVEAATSAGAAKSTLDAMPFDLVLIDEQIAEGRGLDRVHELLASCGTAKLILVSGDRSADLSLKARRAGIHRVYDKPLSPSDLLRLVEAETEAPVLAAALAVPLVDEDMLEDLLATTGDRNQRRSLIRRFEGDAMRLTATINLAVTSNHGKMLTQSLHQLRGGAAAIGASRLEAGVSALEQHLLISDELPERQWRELRQLLVESVAALYARV